MTVHTTEQCAAYDQISDRKCRFYAGHRGKHNFARLDHDSSLERELRCELDELVRSTVDELDKLQKEVAISKVLAESQAHLEEAVKLVDSEWKGRLAEALVLFDAAWCLENGHAPKPEVFERVAKLRKLVHP